MSGSFTNDNHGDGVRADDVDDGSVDDGVSTRNGGWGVRIDDSPSITVALYVADENGADGVRVDDCTGALLVDNDADENADYGIRVGNSSPIDAVQDLIDTGNTATGNGLGNLRVDP